LDQNRYAISLLYKSAGALKMAKKYKEEIDYTNLNTKQKTLLKTPRFLFLFLKKIKWLILTKATINLSAFE